MIFTSPIHAVICLIVLLLLIALALFLGFYNGYDIGKAMGVKKEKRVILSILRKNTYFPISEDLEPVCMPTDSIKAIAEECGVEIVDCCWRNK